MTTVEYNAVLKAIDNTQAKIEANILQILEAAAEPMLDRARVNIRQRWYDTGSTLESAETRITNDHEVNVGVTTPYAKYGEFGTIHILPRAFMRDAFDSTTGDATRAAQNKVNELVK